ncbi:RHS repeat-associated core domain-containing protein [Pyrinomonas methylaliphatogenes]|uniref:RHS repeat-associated core domain n=1 Tax=Pyrinomonas methylaliphatogenes TaxID=454194 RepID=A0A0B6X0X4_9BACT|nr:RHS repeat-associated core domain-containing protein [Pyrinomonas methylaliphatogenes]CDM67183.1 RHS repeat-associated core domain [Pyrinomonas methylaliphatogenes]
MTDEAGNVVAVVELDPWGGETERSENPRYHPYVYGGYERDGNWSDQAQRRVYHGWYSRFYQPDPWEGSYDLTDPQSFNRYAYVQNDPVNYVDPTGMLTVGPVNGVQLGVVTVRADAGPDWTALWELWMFGMQMDQRLLPPLIDGPPELPAATLPQNPVDVSKLGEPPLTPCEKSLAATAPTTFHDDIPLLLAETRRQGLTAAQIAYVLATAQHETDQGRTLTEYASGRAYEGRKDLGNTQPGDGPRYKGRGYVQLTGRRNYQFYSDLLGVDLIDNPELAADPQIAAFITIHGMMNGVFTGIKLSRYVNDRRTDFVNARRVVNGLDRARLIARYARGYLRALGAC